MRNGNYGKSMKYAHSNVLSIHAQFNSYLKNEEKFQMKIYFSYLYLGV